MVDKNNLPPEFTDDEFEAAMDTAAGSSKPLRYVPTPAPEQAVTPELQQAVDAVNTSKEAALRNSYNKGLVENNPDREAEIKGLASETGMPPDAIRQNLDEVKRQVQERRFNQEDMLKRFPHTARFMSFGDNASLVTDDYKNLQDFEDILALTTKGPTGGIIPNIGRTLKAAGPRLSEGLYGVGEVTMLLADQFVGRPFKDLTGGLELPFGSAAEGLGGLRQRAKRYAEITEAPATGGGRFERTFLSAVSSTAQQAPGILATVLTRNPAYALGLIGTTTGGRAAGRAVDAGLSPLKAAAFGLAQGGTEAVFESAPLFKLLGDLKVGSSLGTTLLNQLLVEIPSELATTTVQNFNEWAVLNPEEPFSTYLEQLPSDLIDTVLATTMSVGFQTTVMHSVNRFVQGQGEVERAAKQTELIGKINELSDAALLKERDIGSFEEFIADASEGGPVQDIYIDAETFSQSGIDISNMSEGVKSQMQNGAETGSTVRIPVEEYTARVVGQEGSDALLNHLKLSPDDMSQSEAEVFMQEQGAELQAEVQQALAGRQEASTFETSRKAVEDELLLELNSAGRFTEDVNLTNAVLASNAYAVWAGRLGITPEEMLKKYPLKVQAESLPGIVFEQVGQRGTPEFKQWFGNSKVVDDAGEPLVVYHGTGESFDVFRRSRKRKGDTRFNRDRTAGFFFAGKSESAEFFAGISDTPSIVPTYLSLKNPLVIDGGGRVKNPDSILRWKEKAKEGEHDGLIINNIRDAGSVPSDTIYIAFDPTQIKSATGNIGTFDAADPNILKQEDDKKRRGEFAPKTSTISLLRDADLSSFIHELGHHMLEVQASIAVQEDAPQEIKDDMNVLLKWFGIGAKNPAERLAKWNSMSLEEKRKSHEQFARGFEAYLLEGKAPSSQLRKVFQRVRTWMLSIYKQIKNLNVNLTQEVRQTFDRMLATDEEIAQAENLSRYEPLFQEAEKAGMTPEEFAEYQKLGADATAQAIEELDGRNLRDMKWLSGARSRGLKKLQTQANAKRRQIKIEVTEEVLQEPVYQTQQYLKRGIIDGVKVEEGIHKLSTKAVKTMVGKDVYSGLTGWFGKYGLLADDGMHPDTAAELFGYTSGDEMLTELMNAEPMGEKIQALTDQQMLERHGDLVDPDAVEAAVMESLKNDVRAKFVAAEVNALNKAVGGRRFLAKAAKQFAEDMVSRQRIRDLRPHQYESAESRAAREAEKALAKGDLEIAAMNKRNQLINLYAGKGSRVALAEVDKALDYVNRFTRKPRKGRKALDAEYLDQIAMLLEQHDMKRITGREVDRRVSLRTWAESQRDKGLEPDIPQELLDSTRQRSYKEMTVEEFRGLIDAIKQIEHLGKLKNKLLSAKEQREFDTAKAEMLEAIETNAPSKPVNLRTRTNAGGKLKDIHESFHAMHRKMANLLQEMDGFKDGGPMWEYLVRTMNDVGNRETTMREDATIKLTEITQKILDGKDMGGKGLFFPSVGISLNREESISIVLNMGNAGNMQRLLDGQGWTRAQLQPVLDSLTEEDTVFVQEVWDYFESYRPEIAAKERRVFGREPEWVEPVPLETKYGTLKGGYYPVKYDPKPSGESAKQEAAEEAKQQMRSAYTSSTTRRSFTKSRAAEVKGRPLLYSFNAIYQGTEEIIHDLTHHEWLIDANKILRDPQIDKAIRENYGAEAADLIQNAVQDIARGNAPAQNIFESVLNHIRTGATVAGLAWNFVTSALQPLGLTNSMVRIGPKWVARGINSWLKSPVDSVEFIYERSEFMRLRSKTMQREINEVQNRLQQPGIVGKATGKVIGAKSAQRTEDFIRWSMFLTIQKLQLVADVPTWLGAYEKHIANGESDARASELSDQAVIDAQGAGTIKDLSGIQRGGPLQKLFTNFISYFNVVYNLNADVKKRTDWKDPSSVALAIRDYTLLNVIPAMLGLLLREAITGDDEDMSAEEIGEKLAAEQLSYLLGTMVGVRETTAAVQSVLGVAQYKGSYGGPAGLRLFQELDRLGKQLSQRDMDKALRRSTLNVAGILFHLPSTQINRTWDGIDAFIEGKAGPKAILGGSRK